MGIADCADKPVKAGPWHSEDGKAIDHPDAPGRRHIYHYATLMLSFGIDSDGEWDGNLDTVDYDTGHGSVSDQNGMNKLFARLSMPFYFRRAGGSDIERLTTPNFKYGTTIQSRYDRQMTRMFTSVSVDHVINNW